MRGGNDQIKEAVERLACSAVYSGRVCDCLPCCKSFPQNGGRRHYDMAVLCVLMAAVVSILMFFGEETEWAQMVCLTGAGRNHFFTEVPPFQAHGALRRIWFMDGCTALLSVFRRRLLITFFKDTGKCKLVIKS